MTPQQAVAPKLNMNPTPQVSNNPFADFFHSLVGPKITQYLHDAANELGAVPANAIDQLGRSVMAGKPQDQNPVIGPMAEQGAARFSPMGGGGLPENMTPGFDPTIGQAVTGAKMAGGDAINAVRGGASDIIDNAAARPGGLESGSIGFPDSGGSSSYPYQDAPNSFQKFGEGQNNDVRQIRFKGNGNAPALEDNANNTLDRLGVKGSAQEQLAQINQQVKPAIYKWIKNNSSLSNSPTDIPISDVEDAIKSEVEKQFGSTAPKGKTLEDIVNLHMNNVYDRANLENQALSATGTGNPDVTNPYFENAPAPITGGEEGGPTFTREGPPLPGTEKYTRMGGAPAGTEGPPGYLKQVSTGSSDAENTGPIQNPTPLGPIPQATGASGPQTINSQALYNMKVSANNTPEVSSAFDKIMNGRASELTDQEKIALASRNAYDNILAKTHPDVKQATRDLSVLNNKNVYKSLESARFNPPAPTDVYGKVIPQGLQNFLPGSPILKSVVNNGLTTKTGLGILGATGAAAAGTGLYLAGKASNGVSNGVNNGQGNGGNNSISDTGQANQGNQEQISNNHGQTVSGNGQNVNTGVNSTAGRYSVDSPQSQGLAMDTQKYTQAVTQIEGIINQEKLNNPQAAAIDQGKLDQLKTQWDTQQPIVTAYTSYNQTASQANTAYELAQKASPSLLQLNGSFDSLMKSTNPDQAALGGALQYLQKTTGVNLAGAKDKATLIKSIDQAMNIARSQYQAVLQTNIGGNTLNPPGQTTTTIPTQAPIPAGSDASLGTPIDYHQTINGSAQ